MKKGMLILSGVFGLSMIALILLIMVYIGKNSISGSNGSRETVSDTVQETTTVQSVYLVTIPKEIQLPGWAEEFKGTIEENLLPVNPYSRPGTKLEEVNAIVIHYVGNPGTTAAQNRSYFENISKTGEASVSSHFIVGLEGEIIQCVPLDEISYASNDRNKDTVSIECCHPNKSGKFSAATQTALIQLCAWLCGNYGMDTSDIIRHYDVTGKMCPKYYVKHKDAWTTLKKNISIELSRYSKKETEK